MDAPGDPRLQSGQPALQARPRGRASSLAAWVAQARRDVRMLLDGLRGRHPPPLVSRPGRGHDALRPRPPDRPGPDVREAGPEPRAEPTAEPTAEIETVSGPAAEIVHVHIDDRVYEIRVPPGETILDAALAAGLPMPFSCTAGGCGACKVRRRAGVVDMEEPNCLTRAEREAGDVLVCVGRPVGPVSIEVAPPSYSRARAVSAAE